jgi:lysine 2,3-aminomutase
MPVLEEIVDRLTALPNVRDIRLATKALISLPQHFVEPEILSGFERMVETSRQRDVRLAIHTHVNHRSALTDRVSGAVRALREVGVRDIRNQGVLLAGVNDSAKEILDLCFGLLDATDITPYYFYMCDMVPASEHWRIPLRRAQEISTAIQGYLPGFDTPRLVCDVPGAGKRLVTQEDEYDRNHGISYWSKSYLNPLEDPEASGETHCYYDPVHTLPPEGIEYWRQWALDPEGAQP